MYAKEKKKISEDELATWTRSFDNKFPSLFHCIQLYPIIRYVIYSMIITAPPKSANRVRTGFQ